MAYAQIFKEEGIWLDLDAFITIYEPLNVKFWKSFRNGEITKEKLRYSRLKDTFDACNFEVTDAQVLKIADMYLDYLPLHNHLFPNCIKLLDQLKGKFHLHIITNGFDAVQDQKLKNSGLKPYFKYVLTAETAGSKKPDQAIFERALKDTNALPDNSLMIGDSHEADIIGARNAGLRTIWYNTVDPKLYKDEVIVSDLKDIYSLLLP